MHEVDTDTARRAAENQSLFRQVNDRIKELNDVFDALLPYGDWACECERLDCIERIQLTLDEYEALRSTPTRFAVLPGHENPAVERVVERTDRYWVVEKLGAGADKAAELDAQRS